jgi:hypothetical protein
MCAPPDPQNARSPAVWEDGRAKSQNQALASTRISDTPLDFQARRLRRLFLFCHDTARTIATLAYGVAR